MADRTYAQLRAERAERAAAAEYHDRVLEHLWAACQRWAEQGRANWRDRRLHPTAADEAEAT